MKLVPVETVRTALGFDPIPDVEGAIEASLHNATAILNGALRAGGFDRASVSDTFWVSGPTNRNTGLYIFKLARGLLTADAITVYTADSIADLASASARTDITALCTLDRDKGFVRYLNDTGIDDVYARITYTSGFQPADEDDALYSQAQVPEWLKSAASLQAIVSLANNPVLKAREVVVDGKGAASEFAQVIAPYVRYRPDALEPIQ